MKTAVFVEGLSNEVRFHAALSAVEHRGSTEAGWVLCNGDPGYGKSRQLLRHAVRNDCPMVRAKADWSVNWALTDISDALSVQRHHSTKKMMDTIVNELMQRQSRKGFCLIVDEINHCARNVKVLETLRDLTDTTEITMIAGGTKEIVATLKAHKQILSRVDQFVDFGPATVKDVRLLCDALVPDVQIADDLVTLIQKRTQGSVRLARMAIARVEAVARKERGTMTADKFHHRQLVSDERQLTQLPIASV